MTYRSLQFTFTNNVIVTIDLVTATETHLRIYFMNISTFHYALYMWFISTLQIYGSATCRAAGIKLIKNRTTSKRPNVCRDMLPCPYYSWYRWIGEIKKNITTLGITSLQMAECTDFTKSFLTLNIAYGFTFDIRPEHKHGLPYIDFQETRISFAVLCADIMTPKFTKIRH